MSESDHAQKQKEVARRVIRSLSHEQQLKLSAYISDLLAIQASGANLAAKVRLVLASTVKSGVAIVVVGQLAAELKRIGWSDRGLKWRIGLGAALATAVVTGGQGAGIAALGGAIGVPLWMVVGAGGAFLAMLFEELTEILKQSNALEPVNPHQHRVESAAVVDVDVVEVTTRRALTKDCGVEDDSSCNEHGAFLWIGELDGTLFVFDPTVQIAGGPHVFLWNSKRRQMEKFVPSIARTQIQKYRGPVPQRELERSYREWKARSGSAWAEDELPYYAIRSEKELTMKATVARPGRDKHCFRCKRQLVGNVEKDCSHCRWICCAHCGACGCDYGQSTA